MTLALAVELLGGRFVATAYNDREAAEWPPHPARLFSALVATWAEGVLQGEPSDDQLAALEWMENLPPPDILASSSEETSRRVVAPVFVPVNDVGVVSPPDRERLDDIAAQYGGANEPKARAKLQKELEKLALKLAADTKKAIAVPAKFTKGDPAAKLMPERRTKQPRTFPCVTPAVPRVVFVWPGVEPPPREASGLDTLGRRLVRLGHSSSLVNLTRLDERSLLPLRQQLTRFSHSEDRGQHVLRWIAPGQVDRLRRAFDHHRETEPRVLPARFVRYAEGDLLEETAAARGIFGDDMVILARVQGPRLPIMAGPALAGKVRRALMSVAEEPIPTILSGHAPDGAPAEQPHVAFVALPFVGSEHADGSLQGVAIVLPGDVEPEDRRALFAAVGRLEAEGPAVDASPAIRLRLGRAGEMVLSRVVWGTHRRATLQPMTWCRPSVRWASATPVALDQNPGDLHDADAGRRARAFEAATESVRQSVLRVGLPAPEHVEVSRSSVVSGSAKPREYGRFPADAAKQQRVLVHVRLRFSAPVRGPILLGAGRYQGLGLCLPAGLRPQGEGRP